MVGHDLAMPDAAEADAPVPARSHGRRKLWVGIGAAVALLTAGAITAVTVSFHYLHAPGLEAGSGFAWLPPDNAHTKFVSAGPYDALVIPARPKQWQTFSIDIRNPSSVTQTLLGLTPEGDVAEPERLTVSTTSTARTGGIPAHYTSEPVAIPPGGIRTLRVSHFAGDCRLWGHGYNRSESWTDISVRVRVGAFTRTETIDLGNTVLELRGTAGAC